MKKKKIAVIFGGTNTEHEVSIVSARSIMDRLDPKKYTSIPIKISKQNIWADEKGSQIDPIPTLKSVDIVFPVLHGPFGEDGTIQGMLEMIGVPYVGCGVLASAVCMDKATQKSLCLRYNIPSPMFYWFSKSDWKKSKDDLLDFAQKNYKYPLFIKPSNQGSSIGISKATNKAELEKAIDFAFEYDTKVIVEEGVSNAREIECSVLGNDDPQPSVLGEIISSNDFYDYDAKYIDGQSREVIPAKLPKKVAKDIQAAAIEAFQVLNCSGLARVDFLYDDESGSYYLNELNTMPGFTSISMYPKLWEKSGLKYPDLLDKLISLGLERSAEKSKIRLSYQPKTDWHK